jgi:hypothetical protein
MMDSTPPELDLGEASPTGMSDPSGGMDLGQQGGMMPEKENSMGSMLSGFLSKFGGDSNAPMSEGKKKMLNLASILGQFGSSMMPRYAKGKEFGNTVARSAQTELYADARNKLLSKILSGFNGGSDSNSPFQNSPALSSMDVAGLDPAMTKDLFDTGEKRLDAERKYPMDVAKLLSEIGLHDSSSKYYEAHAEEQKAVAEERKRVTKENELHAQKWNEYKTNIKARADISKAENNGKVEPGIYPIGMDDATWKMVDALPPKEAMQAVKDWTQIEKANNAPVNSIEALIAQQVKAGQKPSESLLNLFATKHSHPPTIDPGARGTMMNQKNTLMASRIGSIISPHLPEGSDAMREMNRMLKPDEQGRVNIGGALNLAYTTKGIPKDAIDKIRGVHDIYEEYTSKGLDPMAGERRVDDYLAKFKPAAPDYKVGDMYEGKKILGINRETRTLNVGGKAVKY